MLAAKSVAQKPEPDYPDSDGMPMAENTVQYRLLTKIKAGLDAILPDFVAGDLFWYPVEGHPEIRVAPDVLVALGRPKGDRSSYRQWMEDGVAPAVVFEIWSPGNTLKEIIEKQRTYLRLGVQEYYTYDPDSQSLTVHLRQGDAFRTLSDVDVFVSPLLGVRLESQAELELFGPDGRAFLTDVEALAAASAAEARAEQEKARAEQEKARAEQEKARADALAARLAALGIEV